MQFRFKSIIVLLLLLISGTLCLTSQADGTATRPTPHPKDEKDWPGKGPVRPLAAMTFRRSYFWAQREKDQGKVIFAGDALLGNWKDKDLAKGFEKLKIANRGIDGDTSRSLLFRFKEDVLDLHPKAIMILIGTHDLILQGRPADTVANLGQILDMIEKTSADLPVVLCTTPPSDNPKAPVKPDQRKALNSEIKKLAGLHKNVVLCDTYTALANPDGSPKLENFGRDKLQLAKPGYDALTSLLTPIFEKLNMEK